MKKLTLLALLTCLTSTVFSKDMKYLSSISENDSGFLLLSQQTNSMKSGVWIDNTNHTIIIRMGKVANQSSLAIFNLSTNSISYLVPWPQKRGSQFEISMTDKNGKIVKKTELGEKFGNLVEIPRDEPFWKAAKHGLSPFFIPPLGESLYSLSSNDPLESIPDCFVLTSPGNYKFTLIHSIYLVNGSTNNYFIQNTTFSPIILDVKVESL